MNLVKRHLMEPKKTSITVKITNHHKFIYIFSFENHGNHVKLNDSNESKDTQIKNPSNPTLSFCFN
jgi:hypothetical protein